LFACAPLHPQDAENAWVKVRKFRVGENLFILK
jgi:hypothetical protein